MGTFLKNYFIPHPGNDHKPHLLRVGCMIGIIALAIGIEAAYLTEMSSLFSPAHYVANVVPITLVEETNQARVDSNLTVLQTNSVLEQAAQLKANDMAAKGYFAHNTPDGKTPWYWFTQAGYQFKAAGENLAVNFTDSQAVTTAWLNSPGHRANIMNTVFSQIGIATAEGQYQGKNVTFVVELFGLPQVASAAPEPASIEHVEVAANTSAPAQTESEPVKLPEVAGVLPAPQPKVEPKPESKAKTPTAPTSTPNINAKALAAASSSLAVSATATRDPFGLTNFPEGSSTASQVEGASIIEKPDVMVLPPETIAESEPAGTGAAGPSILVISIFTGMALLIAVAVILKISVKVRIQHPALIAHGAMALLVLTSFIALNYELLSAGSGR